jgi:MinD-like ATPase involved in chromosome partitioning or flagellar assembly
MKNTRFICFYSYKGGTGRSLTLANIAYLLASEGQKVLIMDMDMEAPGQHMTELFHDELPISKPGLLEMLIERKKILDEQKTFVFDIKDYVRRSSIFDRDISKLSNSNNDDEYATIQASGGIDLLPVSKSVNDEFQANLAGWDWELFYTQYNGEDFLQYLKLVITEAGYDTVLIDSRTGMSEVFFISTFSLADTVVLVSSLNRQNIEGTKLAAKTLLKKSLADRYKPKKIHFVLSPIPQQLYREVDKRLKQIQFDWVELVQIAAEIPYQPELAILENILVRDDFINKRYIESPYTKEIKKLRERLFDSNQNSSIIPFEEESKTTEKTINPFLAIRVEYWQEEQVVTYFVDPGNNISHAMMQFMPTVLFGSRGTGKTMLARWLSYETLAYRIKNPKPKNINAPIGLWFRLDVDILNVFNTKDTSLQAKFSRLFGQFFDLLVLRKALEALKTLGGLDAWCNSVDLFKVLTREMGQTEYPQTYEQMADCIEQCLAELRAYINNPERAAPPYLIQDNVLMKLLVERLIDAKTLPIDCYFIVLIDEYENFHKYQQRIVNTRVKQIKNSDRITYKLLARNGGIHTYETLSENQPIEVTHDFRSYNLDEGLEFNEFKAHVARIIEKHLTESRYFQSRGGITVDTLFASLSAEDEAISIAGTRSNQPLKDWLKKHHSDKNITQLFDWMAKEGSILRQAVAVILVNQGKPIEKIVDEFEKDSKTAKDWYHNYHRGTLHWLCSLYKKDKRYAGFDQIVGIAGNNTRVALDLCYAIIENWLANGEQALPIAFEIQNAAIHNQSETYFRALRERHNGQEDYYRFVQRLGKLFKIIHKGPRQGEPEINHFIIDGELDEVSEVLLNQCRKESVLRWLQGNKQKGKADHQKDAWQLHPRYTPYFDISWRRKKMLTLSSSEIFALFKGDEKQWRLVVKRVDQQYCQLNSSSSTQQNSIFDENHSEI